MRGIPEAGSHDPGTQDDRGLHDEQVEPEALGNDTAGDVPTGYEPL
ncbi:hypothetical protein ACIOTI_31395 [Streptomyces sp. NPDC087843]